MTRLLLILLILVACTETEEPPTLTQQQNSTTPQQPEPECDCDDGNECTTDSCTSGTCVHDAITPCCGNNICEETEYQACDDCPRCESGNCQISKYNYEKQTCDIIDVVPCCGNSICEENETDCEDCPNCESTDKCFTREYDIDKKKCIEKPVIPCCGNDICDKGETCTKCSKDCDCKEGADLSEYPDFLDDGTLLVVGDTASSQDVLTATAMATSLIIEGVDNNADLYSLHPRAQLSIQDLVVLGGPCDNSLWEEYQGVDCDEDYFSDGEATIKLIVNSGREILYVAGKTPSDTKKAAELLQNYDDYDLDDMEATLDTSGSSAVITRTR